VQAGAIFGLLGPNGACKSTAVKVLTTLARADGGAAQVAGFDVMRQPGRVRRAIGVVAQRSGVDVDLTGRENVVLQGRLQGMRGRDLHARADELLEEFDGGVSVNGNVHAALAHVEGLREIAIEGRSASGASPGSSRSCSCSRSSGCCCSARCSSASSTSPDSPPATTSSTSSPAC